MINLTHYDLDGVVSHILLKKIMPDIQFVGCGYTKLENKFDEVLESDHHLVITDLSLDQEHFNRLSAHKKKVLYIDHHKIPKKLIYGDNITFYHNLKYCGAANVMNYFKRKGYKFNDDLKRLVYLTNDYDLWLHKEKESLILDFIFWKEQADTFIRLFQDGIKQSVFDKYLFDYQRHMKRAEEYINECFKQDVEFQGVKAIIIYASSYVNLITRFINDYDIYFIVTSDIKMSLRIGDHADGNLENILNVVADEECVEGAGCLEKAGGLVLKPDYNIENELIDLVEIMLSEYTIPF